jgi:hypothetical protein
VDPIHPDACGGMFSIATMQKTMSYPLSAVGFFIAGAILNNYYFMDVPITRIDHILMLIGFILLSPTIFFVPLYFFRSKLWAAKIEAAAWID